MCLRAGAATARLVDRSRCAGGRARRPDEALRRERVKPGEHLERGGGESRHQSEQLGRHADRGGRGLVALTDLEALERRCRPFE